MKNLQYNHHGTIDAEIELDGETVPTTVAPGDDLYDRAMTGEFGEIAGYVPLVVTAQQAYDQKLREINTWIDNELRPITKRYPAEERDTWAVQNDEAHNWQADNAAITPFLDVLSQQREISKQDLVNTILAKRTAFIQQSALILGHAQKCRDLADQCLADGDAEAIKNIYVNGGA